MADTDKIKAERPSQQTVWDWARDKVLPVALIGTFVAGLGMYTELRVMNAKLDGMNQTGQQRDSRLDDHEQRLRVVEKKVP